MDRVPEIKAYVEECRGLGHSGVYLEFIEYLIDQLEEKPKIVPAPSEAKGGADPEVKSKFDAELAAMEKTHGPAIKRG